MSGHTEPTRQHTKEELMKPGHDHHLTAPPCPDPSAHRDTRLQEQASSAALYVTKPKGSPQKDKILDANNKLSSHSAAQSLKYARPEDLPSYPVVGINTAGSANAAANLANNNQKPFEHWKPDPSADAGKAAMLAKDYKMAPLWKPELSAAGSKAALLAHRDGGKLDLWMPQPSAEGNSAANIALHQKSTSPQLDYGYTEEGRRRALVAATGAVNRSKSMKETPAPVAHPAYPDSANSRANALSAATFANKPSVKKTQPNTPAVDANALRAARTQNYQSNADRQMYTERPPVEIEVEEKRQQAALRASAISMAKQMYESKEKKRKEDEAAAAAGMVGLSAATSVQARQASSSSAPPDLKQQAMQYIHLQEAAQKLAQERLAKLDPDGVARYKAHYGYEYESPRNRLSLRGRQRRRADSETTATNKDDDSSDDEFTSRRIRHQMSGLNNSVAEVDAKKRANDRAALLAAAERKVQAQMHNMDEKVFQETGKVSPAMMEEWEAKARARATADSESRQKNFGKINIGGGRYMDQSELNAIAQGRLQPTLNEISETAEKKRAADEERRLDEEEQRRVVQTEKERQRETKAEQKRLRAEEKAEAKAKKNEAKAVEKARKLEEKKSKEGEKRRFLGSRKSVSGAAAVPAVAAAGAHEATTTTTEPAAAVPEVVNTGTDLPESDAVARTDTRGSGVTQADGSLRPELERHVSAMVTSSSSGSSRSSSISSIDESDAEVAEGASTTAAAPAAAAGGLIADPRSIAERATAPPAAVVGKPGSVTEEAATVPVSDVTASSTTKPVESAAAPAAVKESATEASTTAPKSPTSPTPPTSPTSAAAEQRKSRGFTGFFTKFKRRSQAQVPSESDRAAAATSSTAKSTTTPVSADAAALAASGTVKGPADSLSDVASSSSFRRHEADMHSISSLSSSSSDGEERRGRSGRHSRASHSVTAGTADNANAGVNNAHNETLSAIARTVTHSDEDVDDEDDDEGEFEEARDHFDESLAPPTGFGVEGNPRRSSEHQTVFKEEL
ncbi:hypothetical protein AAFC00_003702 [Neodothiora populina]|uniref:Eisosome protein 1 n=1 Tax=Neodothiora populina TaxID=2781224 RepID=A0ABR3PGC6_9PEZI